MRLFVFVRHGESRLNLERRVNGDPSVDVPLTDEGRSQAHKLGVEIANIGFDLCVHTRFSRTKETAEIALAGRNVPLALSSNLHSELPDNLVRVILEGIREPASRELGFMPAFADSLDDTQVAGLVAYMRERYAPDRPAWTGLEATVARLRAASVHR